MQYQGELAALLTAVFWTITALAFESASLKVGSVAVNIIRLCLALVVISVYNFFARGLWFPVDASSEAWFWLVLSGVIGLVLGDFFLFESFTLVGSRIAMLMMTLVPPITALLSWLLMGEVLTLMNITGMGLTLSGIALVILSRKNKLGKINVNYSVKGLLFAFLGAVGQAVGLVLSKKGMGEYDAFAATQIRIITGVIGFAVLITLWRKWSRVGAAVVNTKAMARISTGAFFGPFLGISFSLYAVQHTQAGIASTLMSIVPVLIIPPAILILKQKVTVKEIVGAIISVCGVAMFFL